LIVVLIIKIIRIGFYLLSLLFLEQEGVAQFLKIDTSYNITKTNGNDLYPSWSGDGRKLAFQSDRNGHWDIYQFEISSSTIVQLTYDTANEQYPVLLQKNNKLVFNSDKTGQEHLYFLNIETGDQERIFNREILAKAATFPTSEYQMYCMGFNVLKKEWGIYRFEFKYGSLRFIKSLTDDSGFPKVSANGNLILFEDINRTNKYRELNIINWYGETEKVISGFNSYDASWDPKGLKIVFVSDMDNNKGELYTIWKDGTHLERITNDTLTVRSPVISPNGKQLAISVLLDEGFDIFIIPFEDY